MVVESSLGLHSASHRGQTLMSTAKTGVVATLPASGWQTSGSPDLRVDTSTGQSRVEAAPSAPVRGLEAQVTDKERKRPRLG